jgi:hypothetical protein
MENNIVEEFNPKLYPNLSKKIPRLDKNIIKPTYVINNNSSSFISSNSNKSDKLFINRIEDMEKFLKKLV